MPGKDKQSCLLRPCYLTLAGLEVVSLCPLSMHSQWLFKFYAMVQVQNAPEMRFSFILSSLCVYVV